MMAQTLEAFAKKHRFCISITHTTEKKLVIPPDGKKSSGEKEVWTYKLISPIFLGEIYCRPKPGALLNLESPLFPSEGKTRKKARNKLIAAIRGTTLVHGYDRKLRAVKVPNNLR